LVIGYWLLVNCCWLLVVIGGYWLLVIGCWLLVQILPKSSYLIRPAGTFSREKEIGIFSFWGVLEGLVGLEVKVQRDYFLFFYFSIFLFSI